MPGKTVLIVGANENSFARFYVRILNEIGRHYDVGRVIISRTDLKQARGSAETFRGQYKNVEIGGAQIGNQEEFEEALEEFTPDVVFITSKGSEEADRYDHHLHYGNASLEREIRTGVEKPIWTPSRKATGKTIVPAFCGDWKGSQLFDEHLPIYQLGLLLHQNMHIDSSFRKTNNIHYLLSSTGTEKVIPDFAAHVGSLFPSCYDFQNAEVLDGKDRSVISGDLAHRGEDCKSSHENDTKRCTITLMHGSRFRGMKFGNALWGIRITEDNTNLITYMGDDPDYSLEDAAGDFRGGLPQDLNEPINPGTPERVRKAREALQDYTTVAVENPLQQFIESRLDPEGIPTVSMETILQVHQRSDTLAGYKAKSYRKTD